MLFTLSVCELGLRIAARSPATGLRGLHEVRPDRAWLYGLRPGARATLDASGAVEYAINEDGFRGPRYGPRVRNGSPRILVLGDSVTFGYGVAQEETFPALMEELLPAGSEVLNFGVGGYNPYNEAALFADRGVATEPDVVLVQFCTNDLTDPTLHFDAQTLMHLGSIPDAAFPDPAARRIPATPGRSRVLGWCRALRLCALLDDAWMRRSAPATDAALGLASLRSPDAIPAGPHREWLAAHYQAIADGARAIGARFAVVVFPFRAQLEGTASARLQRQLVALGEERGWVTLDLLPAFEAARDAGAESLFVDVWHPNAAGHRVAARAIVSGLESRGLLPGAERD